MTLQSDWGFVKSKHWPNNLVSYPDPNVRKMIMLTYVWVYTLVRLWLARLDVFHIYLYTSAKKKMPGYNRYCMLPVDYIYMYTCVAKA